MKRTVYFAVIRDLTYPSFADSLIDPVTGDMATGYNVNISVNTPIQGTDAAATVDVKVMADTGTLTVATGVGASQATVQWTAVGSPTTTLEDDSSREHDYLTSCKAR